MEEEDFNVEYIIYFFTRKGDHFKEVQHFTIVLENPLKLKFFEAALFTTPGQNDGIPIFRQMLVWPTACPPNKHARLAHPSVHVVSMERGVTAAPRHLWRLLIFHGKLHGL